MDTVLNTDFQRFIRGRARQAFNAILCSETNEELFNAQCAYNLAVSDLKKSLTQPLLKQLETVLIERDKLEDYTVDYSYLQGFRDALRILSA